MFIDTCCASAFRYLECIDRKRPLKTRSRVVRFLRLLGTYLTSECLGSYLEIQPQSIKYHYETFSSNESEMTMVVGYFLDIERKVTQATRFSTPTSFLI